ncbi:ABC transporter ATP-binding protein [Geminicoccaceae bacterium 1502E]|nr:ABC transporter ATP-binding protein [Geminicoccaceae bacterium 1502E]
MVDALKVTDLTVTSTTTGAVLAEQITLSVANGEFVGLVGESGSGKTTVGFACLGFTRPGTRISAGRVTVGDCEPFLMSRAQLVALRRSRIAYVPQSAGYALNPALTIGAQLGDRLFEACDSRSVLLRALKMVDLPATAEFLRRYPHQLSGGQQQRVVVAAALITDPKVVIFDEPTTGLDVAVQSQILDMIRDVCREKETAGLFISHDLAAVASLCDRTIVMRRGRIVEDGPTPDVFERPVEPYTKMLIGAVPSLKKAMSAHACPEPPVGDTQGAAGNVGGTLSASQLSVSYGSNRILHGLNLKFEPGKCTAILGESGSGKTTLCRSLIGLQGRYEGTVSLDGETLQPKARQRDMRQRRDLQYVFQNPYDALNPRSKVRDILAKPMHFVGEPVPAGFVEGLLARVSLRPEIADRFPHQLSGGERQRIALARALALRPRVMICDEVTSALDVSVQASIVDLITDLRRETAMTVIFVTHNLALVPLIAENVVVLKAGRIVDEGPTMDVFRNPRSEYTTALLEKTPDL